LARKPVNISKLFTVLYGVRTLVIKLVMNESVMTHHKLIPLCEMQINKRKWILLEERN